MLLTYISICYSKSTNNELGDPIPQNIQSLISNLQNGELPNNLDKLHLGGKKITIKRTEIKIEDASDTKPNSSSSSVEVQGKNNYTNKRGIVLNINENPKPVTSISENKILPSKFQSLNLPVKNNINQLIDNPQIVQNSEKIPTHPVFPMENLVSFIRALEENLEQMPEDEQARNREFDLNTDKGKVHLQRISLNKNDINTLKQAAAVNVAKKQAANQHSSMAKPSSLLSNNKSRSLFASPLTDLSNRENIFESLLANKTEIEIAKEKADAILANKVESINDKTSAEELSRSVNDVKGSEDHEAESIVAQKYSNVANEMENLVDEGNTQTATKTNQNEQKNDEKNEPKKNVEQQPNINLQTAKNKLT